MGKHDINALILGGYFGGLKNDLPNGYMQVNDEVEYIYIQYIYEKCLGGTLPPAGTK